MKFLNCNLLIFKKKINFINEFYLKNFCHFKYNKIKKNFFLKNINKKKIFFKNKSFIRDSNIVLMNKYYNISVYNGNKEMFFNKFNKFINFFFFIFIKKNIKFEMYPNYDNLFKLLNIKKSNFDFNILIKDYIIDYSSIFDIQIIKIPKKYKLKFKKKFIFELKYIYNKKRLKLTLKLINNFIKNNNNLNLNLNLFWTFVELLLNPKNSFLWKRKLSIYNKTMRKFYKKNIY